MKNSPPSYSPSMVSPDWYDTSASSTENQSSVCWLEGILSLVFRRRKRQLRSRSNRLTTRLWGIVGKCSFLALECLASPSSKRCREITDIGKGEEVTRRNRTIDSLRMTLIERSSRAQLFPGLVDYPWEISQSTAIYLRTISNVDEEELRDASVRHEISRLGTEAVSLHSSSSFDDQYLRGESQQCHITVITLRSTHLEVLR